MKRAIFAFSSSAFAFVFAMGIVNLFGDMTYEGGASINGPFLQSLGAGAATISIIAGLGEFLGYSLRSVAGYIADKTQRFWLVTFIGYTINLLAVPAMTLAGNWQVAALCIFAERIGRAIRKPTVEAMLSYSTGKLGKGWVYALNSALDETGATIGPVLMALALYQKASFRTSYGLLLISSLLALVALVAARLVFPLPSRLEHGGSRTTGAKGFTVTFWLSMVAAACFGAGLMSFEFISFHLSSRGTMTEHWIPLGLAISTGVGVGVGLVLGRLYDRIGLPVILAAILVASFFSPLVFFGGFATALAGLLLWGLGYVIQDTLFKALVAGMLPEGRRNFAFGLFYTGYGVGWLVGSIASGLLYEHSITAVVVFSVVIQLASIPLLIIAQRMGRPSKPHPIKAHG